MRHSCKSIYYSLNSFQRSIFATVNSWILLTSYRWVWIISGGLYPIFYSRLNIREHSEPPAVTTTASPEKENRNFTGSGWDLSRKTYHARYGKKEIYIREVRDNSMKRRRRRRGALKRIDAIAHFLRAIFFAFTVERTAHNNGAIPISL